VVALGEVNVRLGPGIEFESIGELGFQDERPIVGRAATAAWWQIFYSVNQQGWVSDQAVTVAGFTAAVPITYVEVGNDGQDEWRPTPNPRCTPPPHEELVLSEDLVATLLTSSTATPVAESGPVDESATVPPSTYSSSSASAQPPQDDDQPFNLVWLLVIGAALIIAGFIALIVQRLRH
jgi:hypothetical protein